MMYPLNAFSNNGKNTMVTKMPLLSGFSVGQRSSLSAIDIKQVNGLYKCGEQHDFFNKQLFYKQLNWILKDF